MKFRTLLLLLTLIAFYSNSQTVYSHRDDAYRASLKKMFEVSGSEEVYKSAITRMFTLFKGQYDIPEELWVNLEKEFLKTSMDDLVIMLAPVYEKHLTISDLESLTAFYLTPVGKKFAKKTPLIMEESMQVGRQWGMKISKNFQATLKENGY